MISKPFLISPADQTSVSYADFECEVRSQPCLVDEIAPTTCCETFFAIMSSIERNANLTLNAIELSTNECLDSVIRSENRPSQKQNIGPMSVEELKQFQNSKSRIRLHSSGTSGQAKIVEHSVASLTRNVRLGRQHCDDVWGLAYHPAHLAGIQVFFQAYCNRNSMVRLLGLDVEAAHEAIETHHVTHLSATPTYMRLLCGAESNRHPKQHFNVRRVTLGGEAAERSLFERISSTFPNAKILNTYALTESGTVLVSRNDLFHIPEKQHSQIRIIDEQVAIHRSLISKSIDSYDESGFYLTGDRVEIVDETPLTFRILGRASGMINVGGFNVSPYEIEAMLLAMPEIKIARVYGKPNSVIGNLVCCDLVIAEGQKLSIQDVRQRLKPCLPKYKIPQVMNFVSEIATTPTGKIQRPENAVNRG